MTCLAIGLSCVLFPLALFGLGGYYISSEKGRGGWDGFWFGLLLGPFGLLIAVLMPEPVIRLPVPMPFRALTRRVALWFGAVCLIAILGDVMLIVVGSLTRPPAAHVEVKTELPKPAPMKIDVTDHGDPMLLPVLGALSLAGLLLAIAYAWRGPKRDDP